MYQKRKTSDSRLLFDFVFHLPEMEVEEARSITETGSEKHNSQSKVT